MAQISHFDLEFLTFPQNFSLSLLKGPNFSLLPLNYSILTSKLSLFCIKEACFAHAAPTGWPLLTPARSSHAGAPIGMDFTMLLACPVGLVRAGRSPFAMPGVQWWEIREKSEKFAPSRKLSKKFSPKVRKWSHCAIIVRNSGLTVKLRVDVCQSP